MLAAIVIDEVFNFYLIFDLVLGHYVKSSQCIDSNKYCRDDVWVLQTFEWDWRLLKVALKGARMFRFVMIYTWRKCWLIRKYIFDYLSIHIYLILWFTISFTHHCLRWTYQIRSMLAAIVIYEVFNFFISFVMSSWGIMLKPPSALTLINIAGMMYEYLINIWRRLKDIEGSS